MIRPSRSGATRIVHPLDGVQWHRQGAGVIPVDGANALIGVSVLDQDTVWAVGGFALPLLKTIDSGVTWKQIGERMSPDDVNRVVAVTADSGWTSGDFGTIQRTDDGGLTWDRPFTGTGSYLSTITAMNMQTAWAVGPPLLAGEPGWLLRTRDGRQWESRRSPVDAGLFGISFVGARR